MRLMMPLAIIVLLCCPQMVVWSHDFPPDQLNLKALSEAGIISASMIAEELGPDSTSVIAYSGTFSETSWGGHLTGTYLGDPVDLVYLSEGLPDSGTYSASGNIGICSWVETGSWEFSPVGQDSISLDWNAEGGCLGTGSWRDFKVLWKFWWPIKLLPLTLVDFGRYERTFLGVPYAWGWELSLKIIRFGLLGNPESFEGEIYLDDEEGPYNMSMVLHPSEWGTLNATITVVGSTTSVDSNKLQSGTWGAIKTLFR